MTRLHFPGALPQISLLLFSISFHTLAQQFTLSPDGNDRNPGTRGRPFRTLTRARDAVRNFRRAQPGHRGDVVVTLRGGRYIIGEPLTLTPEDGGRADSRTIYRAQKGESPLISGGVDVPGWRKRSWGGGETIWVAPLPKPTSGRFPLFRQMWVKSQRRLAARHPNHGYLNVASVPDLRPETEWNQGQSAFRTHPGEIPLGGNPAGGEAVVMTLWSESHLSLVSIERDSSLIRTGEKTIYRLATGDPYYLLNFAGGFDSPGEFLLDAAGGEILYRPMPGEDPGSFRPVVPVLSQLLVIRGDLENNLFVEHLRFEGITFAHTTWHFRDELSEEGSSERQAGFGQAAVGLPAAIQADGMRHVSLVECTVKDAGTYGIALRKGCVANTVERCRITGLGGGGMMIGSTTLPRSESETTSGNTVANCELGNLGLLYHSAVGIWIGQSPNNRIIHNHIHDLYYSGISIGWTWGYGAALAGGNLVAWNHVHDVGRRADGDGPILADMGGIYTLGAQRGTEIRRNYFHDIHARNYGGWGIYYDEGSTGIVSEENLVVRTSHEGFHQHYGKENVFRNNILAFGTGYQVRRDHEEPHTSFAFERNIVFWDAGPFFTREESGWSMVFDRNLYWRTDGNELMADSLPFARWQVDAHDPRSRFADPLFRNPTAGDFRLASGSPALSLGIQPFSIARAIDPKPMPLDSAVARGGVLVRRLLYNNDGSNLLMMADTLTPEKAFRRIDPIAGSGVTTFLHNVNPGQNLGYPSGVADMYGWKRPPADTGAGWNLFGARMSHNLARLVAAGIDPVGMVLDRAHFRGFETFVTFRMNELHDVDKPESPLLSRFWHAHPEYRVGGYEGWGKEALNYALPEVRDYFFSILEEVVARYPTEGLELDFMRFPYYFPFHPDSMVSHAATMTRFVERVRHLTDSTGKARNRPILLAARVPTSLRGCAHMGLDPGAWTRKKLIDFLVISPFLSTETDVPVREFKRLCVGIPIYPTLEFTIGSRQMTREEKRAAAALLYAAGGDGLYLFNYFVAWDAGGEADIEVLAELARPEELAFRDKVYTLAVPRFPVPGVSLPGQVPLPIRAGGEAEVVVRTVESVKPTRVLLRIECDGELRPGDLSVRFNGSPSGGGIVPTEAQFFPQATWPEIPVRVKTLEFVIDPGFLRGDNRVVIVSRNDVTIRWVYLAVLHSH